MSSPEARKVINLGSLFDGIAGFPLAASRHEIKAMWASEIEPFCIRVSQTHFPNMKHLGSVTDITLCTVSTHFKGHDLNCYITNEKDEIIEPVDIITFGSPCQDLSVAGRRKGLYGERSHLFFEAVRIIEQMRETTGGKYPRFAVWENVPGALSSNGGKDFAAVLKSLVGGTVSIPRSGRWTNAGVAFGPQGQVAWRILDAQYWGVPQRRRRIFLVADFGGECAGEILFVEGGLPGDIAESGKAREEVAAGAGDGFETAGFAHVGHAEYAESGVGAPLKAKSGDCGGGSEVLIAQCVTTGTGRRYDPETETLVLADQGGSQIGVSHGVSPTPRAQEHGHQPLIMAFSPGSQHEITHAIRAQEHGHQPCIVHRQVAGTLRANAGMPKHEADWEQLVCHPQVTGTLCASAAGMSRPAGMGSEVDLVVAIQHSIIGRKDEAGAQGPGYRDDGKMFTLDSRGTGHAVAYDPKELGRRHATFENVSPAIKARAGTGDNNVPVTQIGYAVRRLTPLECERLQGLPDGWTNIPGASDTARYRAIGNSLAIPCAEWIMGRIKNVMEEAAIKTATRHPSTLNVVETEIISKQCRV